MLGRTGKQFFLYYILFFLCLIILFIPLYQINLSMVSQSYLDAAESLLDTGLSNLESDLSHIEAVARTVYSSPKFQRLSYLPGELAISDYYYTISLVDDFKRYFISSQMIADCGILYENGMILTNKRLYFPQEKFYGYYFQQTGIPALDQWIGQMPSGYSRSGVIPQSRFATLEGSYEGLTFCINFSSSPLKRTFFFATLEKDYILSRLATDEVLRIGHILICDPWGNVIIDTRFNEGEYTANDRRDIITLEMTGQKRGIQARVDIPRQVFRKRLAPFRRMALIFSFTWLVLGIILSFVFAQRSAKPIREIVEDVLSFGKRGATEENPVHNLADFKNDYKYIQHFLANAGRDLETFNARLARQEEFQRENLFERLLYGLVYSGAAWQTVKEYFPGFPPVFRIAAIALPGMEDAALSAYTMREAMIQDIIEPHLPSGTYTHFSGNTLVLLLPEETGMENLLHRLRTLSADLRNKLNTRCRTALSEPERELRDIHQAFYMVRHLLRIPPKEGDEDILRKENIDLSAFPIELLDASRLYELLLHGEEDKAVDFVNTMFYALCRRGYTGEDDIQQIFFLYRRVLLQIAADLTIDPSGEEIIPAYDSQMELSFLFARVAEGIRKICGIINSRHSADDNAFECSVIAYIDSNLTNPGLYTKMVTGFFHISENRLQSIVRKWTGKSFLEYVESKRMALSREMLLKTSLPISRITHECGYASENSFYKAFRRFYRMSPSEVRRAAP